MEVIEILKELRNEKRKQKIIPEIFLLNEIRDRYKKDPLEELRKLWYDGIIKSCKTLNHIAFYFSEDVQDK